MFKEINVFLQSLFIQKNQFFCPRGGTLGFPACIHIRNFKSKKVSTASKFVVCGKNLDLIKLGAYKSSTGRQTRSNRSQISQGQACQIQREKTYPETMKPQPRLKCDLCHNFFFSLSIQALFSRVVQCQHSHGLLDAHIHPTANVTLSHATLIKSRT